MALETFGEIFWQLGVLFKGKKGKGENPLTLTYCKVDRSERMFPSFPLNHCRILASETCIKLRSTIIEEYKN